MSDESSPSKLSLVTAVLDFLQKAPASTILLGFGLLLILLSFLKDFFGMVPDPNVQIGMRITGGGFTVGGLLMRVSPQSRLYIALPILFVTPIVLVKFFPPVRVFLASEELHSVQIGIALSILLVTLYVDHLLRTRTSQLDELRVRQEAIIQHIDAKAEDMLAKLESQETATLAHIDTCVADKVSALDKATDHMVARVEDATRHTVHGFEEYFARAFKMIVEAEREIWLVNFVMSLGSLHLFNGEVITRYFNKTRRLFQEDVCQFWAKLKSKAMDATEVKIIIPDEKLLDQVLTQLSGRAGYERLRTEPIIEAVEEGGHTKVTVYRKWALDRRSFVQSDEFILPQPTNGQPPRAIYESPSIPIQVLITGLPPHRDSTRDRSGCLVFMVGNGLLGGIKSGEETGFYTELDESVEMYRTFCQALMKQGQRLLKKDVVQ